jgi:hypothetical protein
VRTVNTPILKIDDKTFNNPVTVLDAWADYFEDLATPSEQQSFDSIFSFGSSFGLPPFLKIGHPIPVFNVFGISAF